MSEQMDYAAFSSRYKDREYVGSGGFAKVYKVFDHAKNHYIALKIADVRPEYKQFTLQREVELVNQLDHHRNVARYDACYRFNTGITGEVDFAVLKFYEYGNLEQFLKKQDLPLHDLHIIIKGILEGTAFLHRNDITHRDLKSQNILLNREDGVWVPKIADFGLARELGGNHTMTNSSIGLTYAYAAPEQIMNKRIQKNVDLWAAGVIIYRVIAGALPFSSGRGGDEKSTQSQLELSRKILNLELPDKLQTLAEPYQTIIKRCLVLEPEERAQTAEELLLILNGATSPQSPVPPIFEPVNPPEEPAHDSTEIMMPPTASSSIVDEQMAPPAWQPPGEPAIQPPDLPGVQPAISAPPTPSSAASTPSFPTTPPSVTPPVNYGKIKDNPTQIFHTPIPPKTDTSPPVPPSRQPTTGDPDALDWRYPVFAILFIILCVGGYFGYKYYDSLPATEPTETPGKLKAPRKPGEAVGG